MTIPSAFQIGDKVQLIYSETNILHNCEVSGIKFTNYGKVLYDIYVEVPTEVEPDDVSEIQDVDSCFVYALPKE